MFAYRPHEAFKALILVLIYFFGQLLQLLRDLRGEGLEQLLDGGDVVAAGGGGEGGDGGGDLRVDVIGEGFDGMVTHYVGVS
ncbi:flagellar M-ring protein, putative [Babesia ovata]|uniref:Flagellar M-ring protein, putative n=1 Tax=Babesia ovata TaxID=189622 RepID=A0A2H6KK94_9APIC|nr:flagellar M-ring protein, putative [Babesia ovata]GBE63407.1 flagellar M-ring protein, putative [Babesia ovata]